MVLSLLVVAVFLVGCAPQEELSQEEQQALDSELNQMSDEQLDQVIEEAESEGATALAGQAYSKYEAIPKASKSRVLSSAYNVKLARKVKLARASCNDISCGTDIFVDSIFSISYGDQFQYKSADAMTKARPKIKFKNMVTGETVESKLELRALARTIHNGVRYHLWSDSDYNVDNFTINLVSPCDNDGIACLTEINLREEFVLGGDRFQYMVADRLTKTEPKLKFRNLESGETLELDLNLVAVAHFLHEERRYHFESDSGADYNLDDFRISLFSPCN